jgi:hypothetical protein
MNSEREKGRESAKRRIWISIAFAFSLFPLLATLNSAGYRFGASDQAFYAPAILKSIDADLFPRDSDLIRSQARLTLVDDVVGPVARAVGVELPSLFAILQLATLGLLAVAALRIGSSLYQTTWATAAFVAALTLRHAIVRSGTNTLEGYFHPRQLSFALGALAVGDFLRGRYATMGLLLAGAGALHPTTGTWLAIWLAVATFVAEPRLRPMLIAGGAACAILAAWALTAGPLSGRLLIMDDEWLATLSSKEYLFPLQWPTVAWLINLGYIPIIVAIYRWRRSAGLVVERETALVGGCLSLVLLFAASLPLNAAHVALAIQLQPARIFWMLDFLAIALVVWAVTEGTTATIRRAQVAAAGVLALSILRGGYVMFVEFPERRIAQIDFSDDDWGRAMRWARATPKGTGWLAEADHAARYGTSVRVAAHRDVFVEAIKDGAVGMYDRAVATRTRDRVQALGDFKALTVEHARSLAREYDLDYLVTENAVDLPLAFTSGKLRIYRLRN